MHENDRTNLTLREAIRSRDVAHVRALLVDGVDFNAADAEGTTPLMEAAKIGALEIVQLLLSAGADPRPKDKLGYTAKMIAYFFGEYRMGAYTSESTEIVEMLSKVES